MRRFGKTGAILLAATGVALTGCGGSGRVLESISLSPSPAVAKNGTVQLVATGTYSSAPITVSGIAVNWNPPACASTPGTSCPDLAAVPARPITVNSSGLVTCNKGYSGTTGEEVTAPRDPSLPADTPNVSTVSGTVVINCE
jgi:hypothetical protein